MTSKKKDSIWNLFYPEFNARMEERREWLSRVERLKEYFMDKSKREYGTRFISHLDLNDLLSDIDSIFGKSAKDSEVLSEGSIPSSAKVLSSESAKDCLKKIQKVVREEK